MDLDAGHLTLGNLAREFRAPRAETMGPGDRIQRHETDIVAMAA